MHETGGGRENIFLPKVILILGFGGGAMEEGGFEMGIRGGKESCRRKAIYTGSILNRRERSCSDLGIAGLVRAGS